MTDFDQLIKEKVEQKEYSYSASSWHSFVRKAGLKSVGTTTQSIIIAIASIAVVSVGSWIGIRHFFSSSEIAPAIVEQLPVAEPSQAVIDTIAIVEATEEPVAEEIVSVPNSKPVVSTVSDKTPKTVTNDTASKRKPAQDPILRPKNRRILEIDPDTIKSNE